jgi:transcriptional regulator with XRE-family HTH domain
MDRCPHCDQPLQPLPTGAELRRLRREAGLTQRELAERLELSHTYLSKLENGRMPMPPSMGRRWREALEE